MTQYSEQFSTFDRSPETQDSSTLLSYTGTIWISKFKSELHVFVFG